MWQAGTEGVVSLNELIFNCLLNFRESFAEFSLIYKSILNLNFSRF
jgi:hypothetical protein